MRSNRSLFALALAGLILLLAALACTYPGMEDSITTPPTEAPTAAPPEMPRM